MTDATNPTVGGETIRGHQIECARCSGHGLVLSMCGEPDECRDCGGSGRNWQYPNGAIARYYSGPLIGRAAITKATGG